MKIKLINYDFKLNKNSATILLYYILNFQILTTLHSQLNAPFLLLLCRT